MIDFIGSLLEFAAEHQMTQPMVWHFLYQISQVRIEVDQLAGILITGLFISCRPWIFYIHSTMFIWM